jgi:nucleoside permease NupC
VFFSFGACPRYLLSATVMSAPGSLACSKILYPETEQSQLVSVEDLELPEGFVFVLLHLPELNEISNTM